MQTIESYLDKMPPVEELSSVNVEATSYHTQVTLHWMQQNPFKNPIKGSKVQLNWRVEFYVRESVAPSTSIYHASLIIAYTRKKKTEAEQLALIQEAMQLQAKVFPQK